MKSKLELHRHIRNFYETKYIIKINLKMLPSCCIIQSTYRYNTQRHTYIYGQALKYMWLTVYVYIFKNIPVFNKCYY